MTLHDALSLRTLAVLGAAGLFAATVATRMRESAPTPVLELDLPAAAAAGAAAAPIASVAADDAPRAAPYDLHFTLQAANATWLALSEIPADGPARTQALRRFHLGSTMAYNRDTGEWSAVTQLRELPAAASGWRDHEVTFDGGCRETLHDFAFVAVVSGDPEYDPRGQLWTGDSIVEQGTVVLAAKLTHCTAAFASIAPFHRFTPVTDPDLAARAKALVLASSFASKAAADWRDMTITTPWTDDADIDTVIARDAGTTYVSVHVQAGGIGCGTPTANFWGLYRVGAGNTLVQLQLREVDFGSLDSMIDLDGRIGFLGQALFPTGPILVDASGTTRASLITPYFGCPC